jgi:hypothetical protein
MKPESVVATLNMVWRVNKRAVRLVGAPGVGKTSLVKQFAAGVGAKYVHLHVPTMLVEDFAVLNLFTEGDKFSYKLGHWWPDGEEPVVICLDDASQAGVDLQKVEANLKQERELHGYRLPDDVMIVATGNRLEDKAGANRILSHSADRETQIEVEVGLQDWSKWAIDSGVPGVLVSFFQFRPDLLHDFDPQRPRNATPRSWVEGVAPFIGECPHGTEYEVFRGAVGEGPAGEFTAYLKIYRELPNPDAVMMDPDGYKVPQEPATLYALSGALAEKSSPSNLDRMVRATARMPKEFSVLAMSMATRRDPGLTSTAAFTNWAVNNQDVLF